MKMRHFIPVLLLAVGLLTACAHKAAAPKPEVGEPPLRTLQVGDMTILALLDRATPASARIFPDLDKYPERKAAFEQDKSPAVSRTFVIRQGKKLILVDSGWGTADNGRTLALLAENGIAPAQIDHVLLTHLDGDHIGGLLDAEGKPVYANAILHVSKHEIRAWQGDNALLKAGRPAAKIAQARKVLAVYKKRLRPFKTDETILPGIMAIDARGHTPGHTVFEITGTGSKGQKQGLTIVGDLIHHAGVQLRWPAYCAVYDCAPKRAAMMREGLLARAARSGVPVAGMHFAPVGRVEALPGGGYKIVDLCK